MKIKIAGVFLLIVSGLHIGWGIWRNQLIAPWAFQTSQGIIMFALMSWYVFAVIGSIVGAVLVTIIRKKFIYVSKFSLNKEALKPSTSSKLYSTLAVCC